MVSLWVYGSLGLPVSGSLGLRVYRSLGIRVYGYLNIWVSGSMGIRVLGSLGLWVYESPGLWVYGSLGMGLRVSEYTDLWVYGSTGLRVFGSTDVLYRQRPREAPLAREGVGPHPICRVDSFDLGEDERFRLGYHLELGASRGRLSEVYQCMCPRVYGSLVLKQNNALQEEETRISRSVSGI